MSKSSPPVTIKVLEKEYLIACPEDEKEDLLKSASVLNEKMKEIRDTGKVVGIDRIAVMTALNIVHELLQQKESSDDLQQTLGSRILLLQDKVDNALLQSRQMMF
ncbi:MAG: cell division protein ZapA [Gammaproteobacteria bacterium]